MIVSQSKIMLMNKIDPEEVLEPTADEPVDDGEPADEPEVEEEVA